MIKFVNVSKEYKSGVKALSNINLSIKKGEFVFLVGPSGAGKSTLIKLLLKEENPTEGSIYLNNKDITYVKNRKIPYIRRSVGVVFQDFRLLPNKTVYENVAFAMEIIGAHPKEIRRNVPMVLSMVDLSKKLTTIQMSFQEENIRELQLLELLSIALRFSLQMNLQEIWTLKQLGKL